MKQLFVLALLISSTSLFAQSDIANQVDKLHRKKFNWLINKNYDSLTWLLDDQSKYIHSNGWIQSKQDVVNDLKSGKLNYTVVNIKEAAVTLYGNTATVTGKGNFRGLMPDGSEFNINLLYNEVYIKGKKQWKLINRTATKISEL